MRLYSFVNSVYLSDKQLGIQTAHLVHTMSDKYEDAVESIPVAGSHPVEDFNFARGHYRLWSRKHKTIYVCQGGDCEALWERYEKIRSLARPIGLPYARFYESKGALNGALTAVGLVVPETWYTPVDTLPGSLVTYETHPLREMILKARWA